MRPQRFSRAERTRLCQTVADYFKTWLELAHSGQFDGQGDHHHTPKTYVRQNFGKCLECAIFTYGFAHARCDDCGHDYCYSCKARVACPSRRDLAAQPARDHARDQRVNW